MIKVETTAEILAKKMWHRGDRATARDLFDLCAIADFEPVALEEAGPFIARHGAEFLRQLDQRRDYLSVQFAEIDARGFHRSYDECLNQAQSLIQPLLGGRSGSDPNASRA
jgi:predicted nucleotidyltransferase component of viral defense system